MNMFNNTFNPNKPTPSGRGTAPRAHTPHTRQRGSLLILCITVLVIIALVGIAFLQRTRIDQAASVRHDTDNMPVVIEGILNEIKNQLYSDVVENLAQYPGEKELYDYPWTEQVDIPAGEGVTAYYIDGTRVRVHGSWIDIQNSSPAVGLPTHTDDRWLASSVPLFDDDMNQYRWLHLTNLNGIWLDVPTDDLVFNPRQWPINGDVGVITESDTGIVVNDNVGDSRSLAFVPPPFAGVNFEPVGVDTDQDGVLDARWQWAPIPVRELDGRRYIMALRIIDLNSMLNVNTASNAINRDPSGTVVASNLRGWSPGDADLAELCKRVRNTSRGWNPNTPWSTEFSRMLGVRDTALASAALPLTAAQTDTLWDEQGAIFGNAQEHFLMESELELRRLGGLDNRAYVSKLEEEMPELIMRDSMNINEYSYKDVVNEYSNERIAMSRWFHGADPATPGEDDANKNTFVRNREFPGIRQFLTTASGVGTYLYKSGGTNGVFGRKFDVQHQYTNDVALRNAIEQAFKLPRTDQSGWYLARAGLSATVLQDVIDEYVVAIQDYSDADIQPTPDGNGNYGLEKLPFLREVYTQAYYDDKDEVIRGDKADAPGQDGLYDTWIYSNDPRVAIGDTRAMVIELGNPFGHDITPAEFNDKLRIRVRNGTLDRTWTFNTSTHPIRPDNKIGARHDTNDSDLMVIYMPPVEDSLKETLSGQDAADLPTDLGFASLNRVTINPSDPNRLMFEVGSGEPIIIEMEVLAEDGQWVVYDRMETHRGTSLPLEIFRDNHLPTQIRTYVQAYYARDCDKINYVVDDGPATGVSKVRNPKVQAEELWDGSAYDRLGNDNKNAPPIARSAQYANLQLPLPNKPMRSVAELASVHMFGFYYRRVGASASYETFGERMANMDMSRHFLLVDPTDPDIDVLNNHTDPTSPSLGVPHAAVLMDIMTTVSPENDNIDNNNADGDEDDTTGIDGSRGTSDPIEQFIPGVINVNTAPLHILTLGAPLAESLAEVEALMRTIVAYRDQPILTEADFNDDVYNVYGGNVLPSANGNSIPNMRLAIDGANRVFRERPGIGSLGELMYINLNNTNGQPFNMQKYGRDGRSDLPRDVDMYPDPEEVYNTSTANRINEGDGSNEQLLARFGMLSQTLTVRSDRFAVYGVIRGYDDPNSGVTRDSYLMESARFIAIFDRSSMQDLSDSPRLIGFVRLE